MLGISRAHAYELVARGELPHLRLGRRVVVPKRAIEVLLAASLPTRDRRSDSIRRVGCRLGGEVRPAPDWSSTRRQPGCGRELGAVAWSAFEVLASCCRAHRRGALDRGVLNAREKSRRRWAWVATPPAACLGCCVAEDWSRSSRPARPAGTSPRRRVT